MCHIFTSEVKVVKIKMTAIIYINTKFCALDPIKDEITKAFQTYRLTDDPILRIRYNRKLVNKEIMKM